MVGGGYLAAFNRAYAPRHHADTNPQTTLYGGLTLNLVCRPPRPLGERILLLTNRTDLTQVLAL